MITASNLPSEFTAWHVSAACLSTATKHLTTVRPTAEILKLDVDVSYSSFSCAPSSSHSFSCAPYSSTPPRPILVSLVYSPPSLTNLSSTALAGA